jgi:hypothetical protein
MPKVICGCGKSVDTKPEWAGQWISCPGCNGTLYAPFPGDKTAPPVPVIEITPATPAASTKLCPWCAETISSLAAVCAMCKGDANARPSARPLSIPIGTSSPPTDSGGVMALVVGVLGFMFCPLIGPVAWAMGSRYEKDCRARGVLPSGAGTAGKVLGIVGSVFLFIALAMMVLGTIFSAAAHV